MRIRLLALGALVALLAPGTSRAQMRPAWQGTPSQVGASGHVSQRIQAPAPGYQPAGFVSPYGQGPRVQSGPIMRVRVPGVGTMAAGRYLDLRAACAPELQDAVRRQARSYARTSRVGDGGARARSGMRFGNHGTDANPSAFRFPSR